jgi:5'-AMP-activated protein kinase regulatory gamma subunit
LDAHNSPDRSGFFPHDLDDIYEYKTDHQYFTYNGAPNKNNERYSISSDAQRNSLFRNQIHSLDEYGSRDTDFRSIPRARFDNSSFVRNLNSTISQTSVDSGTHSPSSSSNNSKEKLSHKNHHHHSIQEMIKHFGKKVHLWPRNRHDSINENEIVKNASTDVTPDMEPIENFRSRSKSLDVNLTRKVLDDCESTYKIYNRILKEGK